METKLKDPAATKDYRWDWSKRFTDDTISTSAFTADPGVTVASSTHDTTSATAWISGGTHGVDYKVTNHVVTAGGRTDEWTLVLRVRDQ